MSFRPEAIARALVPSRRAGLLALCAPAALLAAGGDHDARDRAAALAAAGDWRAARVEYLNAVNQDPADRATLRGQAAVLLRLGDGAGASQVLDKLAALGEPAAALAVGRGEALLLQDRPADALAALRAAPPSSRAARVAGEAASALGQVDAARAAFDRALAASPRDASLWTAIARFRLSTGDELGAGVAADRAVRLDGRDVRALVLRGNIVRRQFGLPAALAWYERALEIDPDDVTALTEYGATLGDLGRHGDMLAAARHVLSIDPGNRPAMMQQAVIAARASDCLLARRILGRTGDMIDRVPAAMLLSAACELHDGNARVAADRLAALLAMQPRNVRVRLLLALALHRAGDQPAALSAIRPIADQPGAGSYALTLQARIVEAMGDRAAAMALLDRAAAPASAAPLILDDGGDASALAAAAADAPLSAAAVLPWLRALVKAGRAAEGLDAARRLAEANPGNADAQIVLGDTAAAAGDRAGSWRAYADARRIAADPALLPRLIAFLPPAQARALAGQWRAADPGDRTGAEAAFWLAPPGGDPATGGWLIERSGWNQPALLARLAEESARDGGATDALRMARAAVRAQPLNPLATRAMGAALLAAGRPGDARQWLVKARAMMPGDPETRRLLARAR